MDGLLARFDAHAADLLLQAERLREQLAGWLVDIQLHDVTMRLKSRQALAAKIARPDRTYQGLWDVTDLIGLRVTTYFEDSVDEVARIIEAKLPVDFEHSIDKRRPSDFGYRSVHYVCGLGDARVPGVPDAARFEIQIRTLLQHAWAEIEHDLGYKSQDAVPLDVRRRFSRIAGLLEMADQEFSTVRRELQAYATRLRERGDATSLDRLSLDWLLDQPPLRALDEQIAAQLGRPLSAEAFFPDYLLRMLHLAGVERVTDVLSRLDAAKLLPLVTPYFAFAKTEWALSPVHMGGVYRGYGLFFLAHAAVLESSALGIGKAERLAAFYRALDYPNDPKTAQRVASALLSGWVLRRLLQQVFVQGHRLARRDLHLARDLALELGVFQRHLVRAGGERHRGDRRLSGGLAVDGHLRPWLDGELQPAGRGVDRLRRFHGLRLLRGDGGGFE
jgi:putative GTP pyrophosphokinase